MGRRSRLSSRPAPTWSPPIRSTASMKRSASHAQPGRLGYKQPSRSPWRPMAAWSRRNVAGGDRSRGSRDRRCAGIFPDQLRPSNAFRARVEGGRGLDRAYSWHPGQCLDEEPCRARRDPKRSMRATRSISGGVI